MNVPIARQRQLGMTLIELLVVLVILGLIASIAGPQLMKQLGGAKADTAKLQIQELANSLDIFKLDNGSYPSSAEGLNALITAPAGRTSWRGPYLKKPTVPKDPWGNDYVYVSPGRHGPFDIQSYGADGKEGGSDEDKDIASWE